MKKYVEAADSAAHELAAFMTVDLRSKAKEAGWHPDVVKNLTVKFDGEKLGVHVPEEHRAAAFNHEFGTETIPPTGVLRKYDNGISDIRHKYEALIHQHVKERNQ